MYYFLAIDNGESNNLEKVVKKLGENIGFNIDYGTGIMGEALESINNNCFLVFL